MNTVKSMIVGWVSLITVAGTSFYYAKKNINERRRQQDIDGVRPTARLDWKERLAQEEKKASAAASGGKTGGTASSPGGATNHDVP